MPSPSGQCCVTTRARIRGAGDHRQASAPLGMGRLAQRPRLSTSFPTIARQTDASGDSLVANAVSAAEVRDAIEIGAANGLHVQVWPGFRGLARAGFVAPDER